MFNRGLNHGNNIMDGVSRAMDGIVDDARADANLKTVKRLVEERDEAVSNNAGNFAEKHALREALAKIQPDHPLIQNVALQERIKEAGRRALAFTHDWDAVKRAGQTFKI